MKTIYFDKDIPRVLMTKAAARCLKPLLYTGLNAVKLASIPDPPLPGKDWVRVKNLACGLCGTDKSFFLATTGTNSAFEPIPGSRHTFLGHENVGVVTEVGPEVKTLALGDKVSIRAYMAGCDTKGIRPRCPYCEKGEYNFCLNYGAPAPHNVEFTGAGFGDSFLYPEQGLMKLDEALTLEQGVMLEPTAVSVHSVLVDIPKEEENILVMGCGVIGLGIIQALKRIAPTCKIWALERSPFRQEMAKRLGADEILDGSRIYEAASEATQGSPVYVGMNKNSYFFGGFDRLYDCIGGNWANHTGVRLLKARGTYVKVGHHMRSITYDETPVWWQELRIIGVDAHGMEHYQGEDISTFALVERWLLSGELSVEGFITHRFPLLQYKEAMRLALADPPGLVKIMLDCRQV